MRVLPASLLMLLVVLPACGLFDKPAQKRAAKPTKPHYSAEEYVGSLAMANLDIDAGNAAQLDVIKTYHATRGTAQKRTFAIIDYTEKSGGGRKHSMAVISDSLNNSRYPALQEIMARLGHRPATIHDVRLAKISIAPDKAAKFSRDTEQNHNEIQHQQRRLLANATPLSFMNEVQLKLQLIDFFTRIGSRDAAYLLVDNVKQLLASASERKSLNPDIVQNLSQRLETLEARLHAELPFTL